MDDQHTAAITITSGGDHSPSNSSTPQVTYSTIVFWITCRATHTIFLKDKVEVKGNHTKRASWLSSIGQANQHITDYLKGIFEKDEAEAVVIVNQNDTKNGTATLLNSLGQVKHPNIAVYPLLTTTPKPKPVLHPYLLAGWIWSEGWKIGPTPSNISVTVIF